MYFGLRGNRDESFGLGLLGLELGQVVRDQALADFFHRHALGLDGVMPVGAKTRQRATALRRRLAAQREVLAALKHKGPAWLLAVQPDLWREALANSGDLVEVVDAMLERLRGLQDDAQNKLSTALNDRLYRLTILSAIMLPLSFVTGLLGVNIGGIPARDRPWAFGPPPYPAGVDVVPASCAASWARERTPSFA